MIKLQALSPAAIDAFDHVLIPVWVFSRQNLRIIRANPAACTWLGYDETTLQGMTVADLRPQEERARLVEQLRGLDGPVSDAGIWTVITRSGDRHTVSFNWSRAMVDGAEAVVASLRDMTQILQAESLAERLRRENRALRKADRLSADHLSRIFDGLPGKLLILTPGDHRVAAVTDEFAHSVKLDRDAMLGRRLFDLIPDDPDAPDVDGMRNLRASLQRVETLRTADVMNLQRYPVMLSDGRFEERFALAQNKPVFDAAGHLIYVVHRVEDVTGFMEGGSTAPDGAAGTETAYSENLPAARLALANLRDREARLRSSERLLDLGAWELDLESGVFDWSDRVFEIYGQPASGLPGGIDGYVALVHPDDRQQMEASYKRFVESKAAEIEFQHRIIRSDGSIGHIRGVGTRRDSEDRELLIGFVQDITAIKAAEDELRREGRRRALAGRLAKLGSWHYAIGDTRIRWSEEVAMIHDEPPGTDPDLEDVLSYFLPEYRQRLQDSFTACMNDGVSFDETLQIRTAKGRTSWVRAIGEAIRDSNGRIVSVEGAFQDISELIATRDEASKIVMQLHETLEGMSDAFYLLDYNWRFKFVNTTAETLLKRKREDILGQIIWDVFPEAAGAIKQHYERAVHEGRLVRFREFYQSLSTWFEISAEPTRRGIAVYFRDITHERARDQQLRLLEAAVERLNDILLITEAEPIDAPDGPRIVYVNDAFERRTGFSPEEALGKTPRILQGPKTDRNELDRIHHAMSRWKPVRSELVNYTKSGEEFWIDLDIVPLANESGWFTHWIAVERDITARKKAEFALQATEERFRLVTRAAGSAIWDWDANTNRQWWSDGLRDIFGHDLDPDGFVPTLWRKNVHPGDQERVDRAIRRLKDGQDSVLREQYRFRRSDGTWAIVRDNAFAIRDADGNLQRILGAMTDITEQQQLEDRLHQAQKMETVGQLTGGVAHDFNNLLTIILGNAEILEDALGDQPNLRRLAKLTLDAAERGAELTSRLLAFSRKQPLEPKVLDVARLIQGLDSLLRRTLPEDIDLEIVRAGGLWKIEVDAAQLESALLNLAVNARDAMPDGGNLTIEMANAMLDDDYVATEPGVKAGQYVMIVVTDTGTGMTPEVLAQVFEPFFTTKEVGKGSGLGLSMVFGFVKQSGGHIRIYSELGEGTSIKMYFPRARTRQDQIAAAPVERKVAGGTETILVVEDDVGVREHVITQLASLGYRVLPASSGAEALEILERTQGIDLLFTDVVMPGMGGRDLADEARKRRPDLKVLFTSGYTENSIVHNGRLDLGVKLLSKPYRREQLAAKVRDVLRDGDRED